MRTAHEQYAHRLNVLRGQLYASDRLGVWCFGTGRELFITTVPRQREMEKLLEIGGVLDYAFARREEGTVPSIYSDPSGLIWIPEWAYLPAGGALLILLGPMVMKHTGDDLILHRLNQMELSVEDKRTCLSALDGIPVVGFSTAVRFAQMLHYTIYDENLTDETYRFEGQQQKTPQEAERAAKQETPLVTVAALHSPKSDYKRMLSVEDVLLHSLAEGVNAFTDAESSQGSPNPGELLDFGLKDPLRTVLDNMIIFTGLCSRSAIHAGVPAAAAKETERLYVQKLEQCPDMAELAQIHMEMYGAFVMLVRELKTENGYSKAIRECRDYIRRNCTKPLKLDEIARHVGYSEYYLTRKFTRETGQKLSDYIRDVRIDLAKGLLLTTSKDIQTISEELQFGSRGYFDRCFTKATGMSPARFRESGSRQNQ